MPETIFTIGHSTRSLEELASLLQANRITKLIDIRTVPRSGTNPQFNRDTLPSQLRVYEIAYEHDARLGGLRHARADSPNTAWKNASFRGYADYMGTPQFREAIDALVQASRTDRIAIMCAEAVPWRCHRNLVADALTARNIPVEHIMGPGKTQKHRLTSFAVIHGEDVSYRAESDKHPVAAVSGILL